jgi:SAM-dependent MidA family methyltransferase
VNLESLDSTHNRALKQIIVDRIRAAGPIPFSEFLRLALYHPEHGYYLTSEPALDYKSSPNVHPVFGACLGRQLAEFWRLLGQPRGFTAFEAGAGSGRLAADLLAYLSAAEPELYAVIRYVTQDVSLQGPQARQRLLSTGAPAEKIEIASELPEAAEIEGCILSNELLDALPFERVRRRDGRLLELRCGVNTEGRLVDVETEPSPQIDAHFAAAGVKPSEGCDAEVMLEAPRWVERAARALRRGYLLTLDYGYEAPELYAPWRTRGTLLTFYRHTSGEDPYARIGRQDITASVDFTAIRRAGEAAGLTTLGLTTQAQYLAALGIGEPLAQRPAPDALEAYYALRRAVIDLTDTSGLGRIKVLLQAKDAPVTTPAGF